MVFPESVLLDLDRLPPFNVGSRPPPWTSVFFSVPYTDITRDERNTYARCEVKLTGMR